MNDYSKMTSEEIENEIQARIDFKFGELKTALKNTLKHKYAQAWDMTHDSQYKWQAFEQVVEMANKEMRMGTPSHVMHKERKWKAKEKAVRALEERFRIRERGSREYQPTMTAIVNIIEEAQNF